MRFIKLRDTRAQPEWLGFINRNTNLIMILVYNYFIGHSYLVTFAFLVTLFRNGNEPEKRVC